MDMDSTLSSSDETGSVQNGYTDVDAETDNDWDKEDCNLLNNTDELYVETVTLPFPLEYVNVNEDLELETMMDELILDNNVVYDEVSQRDEYQGSMGEALEVLQSIRGHFRAENKRISGILQESEEMDLWTDQDLEDTFCPSSVDKVVRWKATLDEFLESYAKVRQFIPNDAVIEHSEDTSRVEFEKEQVNCFTRFWEEVENLYRIYESTRKMTFGSFVDYYSEEENNNYVDNDNSESSELSPREQVVRAISG